MNEKKSKRRIQIRDLQKQEIEEKQERRLLIRLHIFYLILSVQERSYKIKMKNKIHKRRK
jgi:hypothetical protein